MRILVTGGAGFVGANLTRGLLREGHDVTVADLRNPLEHPLLASASCAVLEGDVSEEGWWASLSAEYDAVFHQAACTDTTVRDEAFMLRHNVEAFRHLLAWAEKSGTDVMYASSAATYGGSASPQTVGRGEEPINIYGVSKLEMDNITRDGLSRFPMKVIGLRYFNVYGPGEAHKKHMASMTYQLAQQMKAGKRPRIFTDGTQSRDQIYVEDIVQANLRALQAPKSASGIYNVGTGRAVSFNDIVQELNAVMGTDLPPEYIDNPYTAYYQNHTQADIGPTRERLGFDPSYDLARGIRTYHESGLL